MDRLFSFLYALLSCCSFALAAVFYSNERQQTLGFLFVIFYIVLGILLAITSYTKAKKILKVSTEDEFEDVTEDPQFLTPVSETHDFNYRDNFADNPASLKDDLKELSVPLTFHSTVERVADMDKNYHYVVEKIIRDTCTAYQVNYHKIANQGLHRMLMMYDELKGNFFTKQARLTLVKNNHALARYTDVQVYIFDRPIGFLPAKHAKFLIPYLEKKEEINIQARLIGGPIKNYDPKRQMMSYQYQDFQIEIVSQLKRL